ncbi:MAG: 4Fe-4S binding protein [Methanomicrobiales archaeon]
MIKINFSDISIRVIKSTFKTRFTLARACRRSPLMAKIVEKILFEGDHMLVIPRDNAVKSENVKLTDIQVGKEFQLPENDVVPSIVLKEIIKKSKNRVIMNSCICRVSSGCKDYPHDLGCIFLGRGAENISPKLGRRVSIEEALKHVEECQKAGLVHIIGRNKIDSLWLNTGPKEELLSICHCCPCCCLWKMTPELPVTLGRSINPMLGTKIQFKPELCIGCGNCTENVCFMELITMDGNKVKIDLEKCRSCGRCVETCKNGALTIEVDSDSIEKSIKRVQSLVDV